MRHLLLIFNLLLCCTTTHAATQQTHEKIRHIVINFVQQQTSDLPGKVAFTVDDIDKRLVLRTCNNIEAFLPPGSQLIGRVSIGVRCKEADGWKIYIPVQIKITRELLISAQPLTTGKIIQEQDIATQTTETTQSSGLTDKTQVIGKLLRYSLAAGSILRADMLRAPFSVKQGQSVQLLIQGSGFNLSSTGVALNNASGGEIVQVRTSSGKVISGTADANGSVVINQ